ncbi:MAG: transcription initiation factor TFIIE subunit alpha [Candidatus Woesearchaeota archaeon]|jgi:transcription initiation factor TFIIE subunit alpha
MKMTKKLTEYVITQVSGEDTLPLVDYLTDKENTSEFVIAEEMELEIQTIRNRLYRLLNANLVSFNRKKDKQKGWYIYYWTFNTNNIAHLYWQIKEKRLDNLKDRLHREKQSVFFHCVSSCIRLDFETAISFDYSCPECGEMITQQDNSHTINQLQTEMNDLEKELKKKSIKPVQSKIHSEEVAPVIKKKVAVKAPVKKKAVVKKVVAKKKTVTKKVVKKVTKRVVKTVVKKAVKKTAAKKTTKKATKKTKR